MGGLVKRKKEMSDLDQRFSSQKVRLSWRSEDASFSARIVLSFGWSFVWDFKSSSRVVVSTSRLGGRTFSLGLWNRNRVLSRRWNLRVQLSCCA
jgi:hypothetical protein